MTKASVIHCLYQRIEEKAKQIIKKIEWSSEVIIAKGEKTLQDTATTASTASSINNSESNEKNNSLTLDCCCVLVQITPVATGKGSQPSSVVDVTKKTGDGISGRANGAAPICRCSSAVANNVSRSTEGTNATPSTSKSLTGQSFGAKSRSGSLDQLLFLTDQLAAQTIQRQENRQTGRREITADDLFNYLKDINGDLKFVDKKKLAQLLLQNTETIVAQQHHQLQHQTIQSATGTIRKHAPASRQESSGEPKQIHFVNHVGPTPPPSVPIDVPTKGILQTRKVNSGSKFGKSDVIDPVQQQKEFSDEWLNRSHFQRTSSRSVDVSGMSKPEDTTKKHHKHHQRHFSGPEDLEALKKDITHWLERLPYKKDAALLDLIETAAKLKQQQIQSTGTKPKSIIKNEFADIIRPPLPQKQRQQQQQQPPPLPLKQFQRQKSADDLRVLKNNILEWLTKQQIMNQQRLLQHQQQQQQQQMVPLKSAIVDMKQSSEQTSAAPPPLPRKTHQKLHKRHSLGPSDTSSDFHEVPDWIQIPIDKLNKMREVQKSCTEMSRKGSGKEKAQHERVHHRSAERKLRHSASEVVQSNVDRNYQKHNQQQLVQQPPTQQQQPQQIQYQLIQHQPQQASASHHFQQTKPPEVQYQVVQRYREPTAKSEKTQHHSHHGHHGHGHSSTTERSTKRDKPRHRQTQRSATTGNILQNKQHHQPHQPVPEAKPIYQSTTSLALQRCDDPMCPLLPICTDPNCYLNANSYYDTPRRASLPPHSNEMPQNDICTDPRCCEMLPLCTDPRCCGTIARSKSKANGVSAHHKFKSNSLPRCVESTRRSDLFLPGLSKDESYSSLPKSATLSSATARVTNAVPPKTTKSKSHHRNGNNKLMKSASTASLHSRRRRHKTVHFGENLLREVCQNRQLIRPLTDQPSNSSTPSLQPNIQMLYNFVEGVLSAWVDEEDDENIKSGPDSEPERGAVLKPMHRCNRARMQTIRRVVNEAASLKGTLKLGNSRYRHRHWRGTAKDCNERFLRKISDDDRMSLTTAISDEDDGESIMASPYKAKATGTAAASFNCTGAVRKAGFLSVKKWLLRKKHQIELARKRGWKGYWVCLKGTTLLFYPCDSREGRSVEAAPKHLIIVDGAIMQPIPEHPKRDYIFCLSTAFGDAYLFQAPCQVELENWVNSIHSACAAAFARHRGKTGTLHLLQEEIFRLDKAIESDHKLKHMADLQQSVVTDQDTRHQIQQQIITWEENLERLHCEQFRLRCYMASLQCGELPNPKSLLTHVSRPTKNTLNKLGVFTVSSFHAFICARSPSLLNNLLAGRGATKRRPPLLSRSNSGSSRRSMQMSTRDDSEKSYNVPLPDNSYVTVYLRDSMTNEEFLASACVRKNLNPMEHFVRVKKRREMEDHNYFVPHRNDLIETYLHTHEVVEVCAKILYQVELQRSTLEQMWGFSVEAELIENADRQDELCCYVSRVEDKSVALQNGIIKGDEIIVINGAIVSDLDMMYLESVLQEEQALCMMMRSSRVEPPDLAGILRSTDDIIESLVCPPPPSDPPMISEEMISGLIVPAPGWRRPGMSAKDMYSPEHHDSVTSDQQLIESSRPKQSSRTSSFEIENLLKTAEQVTTYCRSPQETRKSSPTGSVTSSASNAVLTPSRQLTDAEKLRKVILELVDTERAYVKHLNNLLENYLEPLKRETFLSNAEITALFGNIQEIVTFQRQFLQNLEEALEIEPDFHRFEHSSQFKNVLFAIGSAFLYYVNHFKLYSSFCASHSKAQKVLHPNEGNQALQEFLLSKNPRQEHSSTLESYLIKPIQRILKYPLLLQQLKNLTDPYAEEHHHLIEALKGMEKVAEHINEMQRIHEEYGAIFDHLFRQHQKSCKQPLDLSPDSIACLGDLLYYGGVEWLNISDFLGKIKKGLELHAMCFVFKSAVVFLCKERLRQKKKLMGVSSKNTPNEVEIIRYQVLIPVTEVQVRASSAKDMDSHFLWELIHLRSQLQRRSEKVYVLSNSTADFRNAFLKTIRQIIRESVRNMSIPMKERGSMSSVSSIGQPHYSGNSQTLERPKQQSNFQQGSHTLGKPKKKTSQRLSTGNIDYDNLPGSHEHTHHDYQDEAPPPAFRIRSKTVGDEPPPVPKRTTSELSTEKDPGVKSEGEEESLMAHRSKSLGRTPNHLTLSTTSTLSVGSTGSQARLIQSSHAPSHYQPVLMKDLGKTSSTDSTESISFHTEKSSDSTSGVDVNDDVCQLTDEIVDKHLADLKRKCMSYDTRDVAKFMEKLKTQSESLDGEGDEEKKVEESSSSVGGVEKRLRKESESKKELESVPKVKDVKAEAKTSEKEVKKDTIQVKQLRKSSLSPQGSMRKPKTIDMDTYASSSSGGDNQVHIVKIKSSPSGSRKASRENSRSNSTERSPSKEKLKKPEGGILKKPSPKFGKASESLLSNSLRPDCFISPFSSFESKSDKLSPSSEIMPNLFVKDAQQPHRASFSEYERDPKDYHHQAMKSRSLESSLEHLKSAMKHQSSYESGSPTNIYDPSRYYGLSSQQSIESNRSPVRYCSPNPTHYYNEPFYEYPKHHHQKKRRESRSLERPDYSRQSSSEYERYYEEPQNRRHSVYEHRSIPHHYYSMSPDDYLMSHYEQPSACVDCYYQSYHQPHLHYSPQLPPPLPQRNQPQQKSPSTSIKRQSRSRKKLSRRMSSNYFNKSFDDDDIHAHASVDGKQTNDNEEIRV
ncbi:CLUMA_CG019614, isoform A [Clunio marinus]|uniref:CLUMA_CG019614, isoform A n=1 Tax=Clunio marinus TaxID=568069 RepID=A0A1J1J3Q4_9DIPT|nr:CLUMA_CG019614, isoform A [Clunio marinus]